MYGISGWQVQFSNLYNSGISNQRDPIASAKLRPGNQTRVSYGLCCDMCSYKRVKGRSHTVHERNTLNRKESNRGQALPRTTTAMAQTIYIYIYIYKPNDQQPNHACTKQLQPPNSQRTKLKPVHLSSDTPHSSRHTFPMNTQRIAHKRSNP